MSGEESQLANATSEEQNAHTTSLNQAANLTGIEIEAGVAVWERVRPAWRSAEVCVYLYIGLGSERRYRTASVRLNTIY